MVGIRNHSKKFADGTVIVQIGPTEYQELELKNLVEGEQRKYGSTLLIFYDRMSEGASHLH